MLALHHAIWWQRRSLLCKSFIQEVMYSHSPAHARPEDPAKVCQTSKMPPPNDDDGDNPPPAPPAAAGNPPPPRPVPGIKPPAPLITDSKCLPENWKIFKQKME